MSEPDNGRRSVFADLTPRGTLIASLVVGLILIAFWIGIQLGMDLGRHLFN